jgi:hypothetical protein
VRSGAAGAVRRVLAARGARVGGVGGRSRASNDRDRDVRAVDGPQVASRLGLPDAGRGGVGLDSSAALLPGRAERAGARRVDGPQAHAPHRTADGQRHDAGVDRCGGPRAALCGAGGPDRLDGDRGRHQAPDRRGPGRARRQGTRQGGSQAGRQALRDQGAGARPLARDGAPGVGPARRRPRSLR